MERKELSRDESITVTSNVIEVKPDHTYLTSATITGIKGSPYSAYFMVSLQDQYGAEITKRIRWIDDYTRFPKEYMIIFKTPSECKGVVLGYRINELDNPVKSDVVVELPDPKQLFLSVTENAQNELFDDRIGFEVPELPPLTLHEEKILEKKIVWIFGTPRSGTTWLSERLLNHPKNIFWNEPFIGRHLAVMNIETDENNNFHSKSLNRIYDWLGKMQHTYFFYSGHKKNWLPALRKLILARAYSEAQTLKKNIIIKEPAGSNAADIIMESLSDSRLIFVLRDGRDTVESRIAMFVNDGWAKLRSFKDRKEKLHHISYFSYDWVHITDIINRAYENHNSNLRYLVRYEILRNDTFNELKKIYNFLGVDINDEELAKIVNKYDFNNIPKSEKGPSKFNRAAEIGGWKNNFDEEEKSIMNSIMGPTLIKMGYSV